MGGEFYRKGASVALGPPVVGPLGRIAEAGRNWEGFSNNPYLAGVLGAESVHGIQDAGVIACTKHFIVNEQETNRIPLPDRSNGNFTIQSSSSNVDDKTVGFVDPSALRPLLIYNPDARTLHVAIRRHNTCWDSQYHVLVYPCEQLLCLPEQ